MRRKGYEERRVILDEEEGLRREESTYLRRKKGYEERRVHT